MILLHGGFTPELINGLIGGFVGSLLVFVGVLVYAFKSKYYQQEVQEAGHKIFAKLIAIALAAFLSFISFFVLHFWWRGLHRCFAKFAVRYIARENPGVSLATCAYNNNRCNKGLICRF